MYDRRRFVRWQINKQARVKMDGAVAFAQGLVRNINFKGLQLSLKIKIPEDKFLKLTLVLTQDFTMEVEVWVTWHKVFDGYNNYGLYFTKIRDSDRERIYILIRSDYPEQINRQWWGKPTERSEESMEAKKTDDKRIFERFSVRFPVRFLDVNSYKQAEAQTYDVSAKGMGILANEELPVQADLELWLRLPDRSEPIYTRGKVIWSKPIGPNEYRTGISLEKADFMGLSRVLRAA